MKYLFLLLIFPCYCTAQKNIVNIQLTIQDSHPAQTAVLIQNGNQQAFPITDNKVTIADTIDHPMLVSLIIMYKGWNPRRNYYSLYLSPGNTTIQVVTDKDSMQYLDVSGPELTADFQNKLENPVFRIGLRISALQTALQKNGPDSLQLNTQLNKELAQSFATARDYIRQHPNSPLSLIALTMMGEGDPTIPNPKEDLATLYQSLTPAIKNSEEGRKYLEQPKDLK